MRRSGSVAPLGEVVVLSLAAARLARAVSVDEVSRPLRDRLHEVAERPESPRWQRWVDDLTHCPVCTGWWTSLAVSIVAPGRHRLLRGVAVAGGQVALTLLERLVSEEGRAAVHEANRAAHTDPTATLPPPPPGPRGDGAAVPHAPV